MSCAQCGNSRLDVGSSLQARHDSLIPKDCGMGKVHQVADRVSEEVVMEVEYRGIARHPRPRQALLLAMMMMVLSVDAEQRYLFELLLTSTSGGGVCISVADEVSIAASPTDWPFFIALFAPSLADPGQPSAQQDSKLAASHVEAGYVPCETASANLVRERSFP